MNEAVPHIISLRFEHPLELRDKCLQVIAENFEEILSRWSSEMDVVYLQRRSQLLMEAFRGKYGKPISLQSALFCLPYIKELDLLWFKVCDRLPITRALGTVENAITVLNASDISSDVLNMLLPLLPKTLKCLNLEKTCVTDNGMKIIASKCHHLEELNLHLCKKIGDLGLKALCDNDEQGNVRPNLILRKLNLDYKTAVTIEGVEFILNNCPNLSEFGHEYVSDAIYQKCSRAFSSGSRLENEARYNLKSLDVSSIYSCNYLRSFNVLCPLISKLRIGVESQQMLNTIAEFPLLIDVQLAMDKPYDLLYFLRTKGRNLKALGIVIFECEYSISSDILVHYCPRLERLCLNDPKFAKMKAVTSHSRQDILCSLTELKIIDARPDYLEESLIYILSRSPSLEKFTFWNTEVFVSSSFVSSLISCNVVSTLKEVEMSGVDISFVELQDAFQNFRIDIF